MNVLSVQSCLIILLIVCRSAAAIAYSRCYGRLEHALDDMLYKSASRSQFRSLIDLSGYRTEYEFKPEEWREDDGGPGKAAKALEWKTETRASEVEDLLQQFKQQQQQNQFGRPNRYSNVIQPSRVEVSNIKFRVPRHNKWVKVDRCDLLSHNQSLDTRLSFPDLTIYGRVTLQPIGGHCDMILRLRRVGIDFKTSMLPPSRVSFGGKGGYGVYGPDSESRNMNVRTDSYFTEPGFMSIFAHGCAGPQTTQQRGNRINSKKPLFREPSADDNLLTTGDRKSHQRRYWYPIAVETFEHRMDSGGESRSSGGNRDRKLDNAESMEFDDDAGYYDSFPRNEWHQVESNDPHNSDEIASAFLRELESLFSKGAQGILTSYIQRMLQPAIKNTLMEGMGYTISYG